MSRNTRVIWAASILFGLALGAYDFVLPYHLQRRGLAYPRMAVVFALSSLVMFLVRVWAGRLADRFGPKRFYSLALFSSGVANLFTPMAGSVGVLSLLRSLREAAVVTREAMHALLLYRENRGRYAESVGKTLGSEYLFQGLGTLGAGALMVGLGLSTTLFACAGMLFGAFVLFTGAYRDPAPKRAVWGCPERDQVKRRPFEGMLWQGVRLFWFDMPRELQIIAGASFLFSVGLSCSHGFIMPLFFSEKFGAPEGVVALIMAAHRITLGFPMLFAAWVSRWHPRNTYAAFMALEGTVLAASAVIPTFLPATLVWLLHDFFGAGVWLPIQSALIQRYSQEERRGLHVAKTQAFSALGWVVGPVLTGYLAPVSISAPFFFSGVLVALSALPLLLLPNERTLA